MNMRTGLYFWAIMCLIGNTCCKPMQSYSHEQISAKGQEAPRESVTVVSNISATNRSPWKILTSERSGRTDFTSIYFLDETHGWVGGDGAMYKTSDGGQSWEQVKINMPSNTYVAGMFFSHSLGWAALQKHAPDSSSFRENQFYLMQTSDAGQSWQLQYTNQPIFVTRLSFFNEQEGWLTGVKYIGSRLSDTALLVLHTSNQGKDWEDVSDALNRIAVNDKGFVIGWIMDLLAEESLTATVLTSNGHLFRTDSGGQSWQQVDDKRDSPLFLYTNACCLGFNRDKLHWIAGGQYGEEGTESLL